jgi:phosphodiesterase/alkaline phosphatase D-like protein
MAKMTRREAILAAVALGASLAWRGAFARGSRSGQTERRDLFPQGVASADPYPDSVLLWTRRPYGPGEGAKVLLVEVARDPPVPNARLLQPGRHLPGERLDLPSARRRAGAGKGLLVPLHR